MYLCLRIPLNPHMLKKKSLSKGKEVRKKVFLPSLFIVEYIVYSILINRKLALSAFWDCNHQHFALST